MYCRHETLPASLVDTLRQETLANPRDSQLSHITFSKFTQQQLTKEFLKKGWRPFEYAIAFTWTKGMVQPIHIDGSPPSTVRKSSVNLIVQGGEGCVFQWYDTPYVKTAKSDSGILSWGCDQENARLIHAEPLLELSVVKTDVPHRVNVQSDTILLCLRMRGNPQLL